ncbi:MAG TPA: DUF481 domain-containing protein [Pyrinomonadaceae bacterium]|nr:DUF481 domain-containing protein [Pyrinomonadaceae bacterium]
MKRLAWLLMPVLLCSAVLLGYASEVVTLKNGDRVSGKIVEETEEIVVLETEYAGKIKIERTHIDKIANTSATVPSSEKVTIEKASFAEKTTALASVKPAKAMFTPPPKRLFGGGFRGLMDGWDGNANIGFSYTSGNSKNTTMTTGLRAAKSGGRDNLTVYARSLWNTNRGTGRMVTTQNAFWGGARYDRDINDRMFGFVSYDFERDRPQKLNLRSVVGGGTGRHWIKSESTDLDVLVGAAWNRTWQQGNNTDSPEALTGVVLKHKFHDRMKIQNTFTYFQNVTDAAEYRFIFDATVSTDVTKRVGVFFSVGDRYNNDPFGTSRKNDFLFTTGMKWNFGRKK